MRSHIGVKSGIVLLLLGTSTGLLFGHILEVQKILSLFEVSALFVGSLWITSILATFYYTESLIKYSLVYKASNATPQPLRIPTPLNYNKKDVA